MVQLTAMDEFFVHQIPEPLPATAVHHEHWRESLFFILHPVSGPGDVLILTMAHFPARQEMDALQLGHVGGQPALARHHRPYDGDPHTLAVGPARIDIAEPYRRVELHVADDPAVPVAMDVTFTARTAPVGLRRGTMRYGHELVWDQSHMIQSGTYTGSYTRNGVTTQLEDYWGQRDHSWGIREHARCPFWMWLALQFPEGMLGLWHWELANGAPVFSDGAFAPADGSPPVPIVRATHEFSWIDGDGKVVSYEKDGPDVTGINGSCQLTLEGGETITVETSDGVWAQRYGPVGGGLTHVQLHATGGPFGTGSTGSGIVELTGAHHHRYFPVARAERLPGTEH